jgi:glycosyltransferase involved in cell wall biosynthesis
MAQMFKHRITVFTPTYNRANTLERLFDSLRNQTFKDFEWLVIDDGSADNTETLFDNWLKEENDFMIRYIKKENGGKHTAINFGLDHASGELFFTADSDDYITEDALQKVNSWANSLPKNGKFCGVVGNWGFSPTETPNLIFDGEYRDSNLLERYREVTDRPVDGERAYVFFTEIHKKYKYPIFKGEIFMSEAVAWNRMANDGFKIRVFNDIIYIYKFLEGGLTLTGERLYLDNPKGYALWLREKAEFCDYSFLLRLKMIYSYYISVRSELTKREIAINVGASLFVIFFLSFVYLIKQYLK